MQYRNRVAAWVVLEATSRGGPETSTSGDTWPRARFIAVLFPAPASRGRHLLLAALCALLLGGGTPSCGIRPPTPHTPPGSASQLLPTPARLGLAPSSTRVGVRRTQREGPWRKGWLGSPLGQGTVALASMALGALVFLLPGSNPGRTTPPPPHPHPPRETQPGPVSSRDRRHQGTLGHGTRPSETCLRDMSHMVPDTHLEDIRCSDKMTCPSGVM